MSRGLRYTEEAAQELQERLAKIKSTGAPGLPPVTVVNSRQTTDTQAEKVTGAPSPSKYRNRKAVSPVTGRTYASKKEAKRAGELHLRATAGEISDLREQVRFVLIPAYRGADGKCWERKCEYVADFVYLDSKGHTVVEDAKGFRLSEYVIKRKLMLAVHGIRVREV